MYRQPLDALRPGMVVAQDVLHPDGRVLIRAGVVLTPSFIEGLRRHGQPAVMIGDGLADDIAPRDIISSPLRASVSSHLSTVFKSAVSAGGRAGDADKPAGVDDAIARLGERPLQLDDGAQRAVARLYDDIELLLSEVLDEHTEAGLESLKTHSDYTYHHSIDVAAVAALVGRRAGLDRSELRELALGCLMHDVGKMYIDLAILDKPGPLTPEERAEVEKHPRLGFELIRRMPLATILPAHVAFQHHERQDGGGYPNGLIGSNRIARTNIERLDSRRMLLIAEIAAVADVYSALTSDRPYRAALHHDVAADVVAGMAGRHLNADLVSLFLRTFPRYPVGHWAVVTEGCFRDHRGVVVAVPAHRPDRPTVRLLLDAGGSPLQAPVELVLASDQTTRVTLVDAPRDLVAA